MEEYLEIGLEIFKSIVRAGLAGGLVYTFCTLALDGKVPIEVFVTVVIMGIVWYNREKENNNNKKEDK